METKYTIKEKGEVMRIAIVTIYQAFNYGSFLQAYAMQETLKKMGHEVTVLDCGSIQGYRKFRKMIALKKIVFSMNRFVAYKKDWKKLNISNSVEDEFDVAVIGSDEVWNIKGNFEQWPQYLGEKINAKRLIAYAPSVGFSKPKELLANKRFTDGVRRFDAICPRDNVTRDVCLKLSNNVTERVIDPTLLMLEDWEALLPKVNADSKYVVYYSYLDDSPMKNYILRFAKEHKLRVVIAGFDYSWGDQKRMVSPLGFLTLLKNAEYIFTSTFHGSVLSTILQKKIMVRPSGQKVIDYLELIGLSHRQFIDGMDYADFEKAVQDEINYDEVKAIQRDMREKSMNILEMALNGLE